MCKAQTCTVCRCDEKDIPMNWIETDKVTHLKEEVDLW